MLEPWFTATLRAATFEDRRRLIRYRAEVHRLHELDLRDRWGYELSPIKLAILAEFVVLNSDHEAFRVRKRASAAMVEIVDRLALAMMVEGEPAMFCPAADTPPEDDDIETVVRTVLNLKETN